MAATVTLTIPDPRRARARWLLLGLAVVGLLAVTTVPSFSPRPSLAADATNPEHTISETVDPVPYPVYFGAAQAGAVDKSVASPNQPGTSEVSVTVVVVYRIP